jgi:hypothetical protein
MYQRRSAHRRLTAVDVQLSRVSESPRSTPTAGRRTGGRASSPRRS